MLHRLRAHHDFMTAFAAQLVRQSRGPIGIFLCSATVTALAGTATLFLWVEHGRNPGIESWFDALYFTVTTMTGVGFGDIVPKTGAGRVVAMLAMLGGTALFASYTALFASALVEIGRHRRWSGSPRQP